MLDRDRYSRLPTLDGTAVLKRLILVASKTDAEVSGLQMVFHNCRVMEAVWQGHKLNSETIIFRKQ
jgi:hypothetical protein